MKRYSQAIPILQWLIAHGEPASISQIAGRMGKRRAVVENAIWKNPSLFVKASPAEIKNSASQKGGGGKPIVLWKAWEL